ncbi:fork head domain-containing protein, partial [Mycena sp. CBHHK59/15]
MPRPPQWPAHEHMLPAPAPYHAEPSYFYQPEQSSNPSFPNAMPPSAFQSSPRFPDAGDYLRQQLNLPPGAPVNLWSVPEPPNGEKPTIPLPMIYKELIDRFHWFREHQNEAWKNSIRHNLSLNKVFRTMQRPVTEPGKGSYWELDVSGGEGYKRARKRLGPKKNTGPGTSADDDEEVVSEESGHPRHRVNTDRSHESSSPPTTGSSRSGSVPTVPTIDPPASQRRATTSGTYGRQPAYGQQGFPPLAIDPALIGPGGPTNYPPPSSYTPPGHTLAHLHSATPIDAAGTRDEGIASRLRARTQMSRSTSAA